MPIQLFKNKVQILLTIVFVFVLIAIRAFEESLFYDPFLEYFSKDYTNLPLPEVNKFQLFLGLFFRYFFNTIVSLAIIYVLLRDIDAIKFASFMYVLFFVILISVFFYFVIQSEEPNKMGLFYIRRFLIQPIFLLLFLPAFYYQKQKQ
jgi:exosortase F-associated protein